MSLSALPLAPEYTAGGGASGEARASVPDHRRTLQADARVWGQEAREVPEASGGNAARLRVLKHRFDPGRARAGDLPPSVLR